MTLTRLVPQDNGKENNMAELVVMKRQFETMNVPTAKLQEYLDAGWVEVARVQMTGDAEKQTEKKASEKPAESKK